MVAAGIPKLAGGLVFSCVIPEVTAGMAAEVLELVEELTCCDGWGDVVGESGGFPGLLVGVVPRTVTVDIAGVDDGLSLLLVGVVL